MPASYYLAQYIRKHRLIHKYIDFEPI
ncbi:hypothetical protein NECAME_08893 [Necator americanus]|uniref:Uncharacterized protein n=1 Tax=Necator americanus TaxID=51031 RepID=W2TI35_NECAM|nr:hypothetical protein NECAME_08893 [Necator americanus]ETN80816.1 hypothetical protein NECAME_08893 [Necator americanus]